MKTIKEIKDHFSKDEIKILIEIIRGRQDFDVMETAIRDFYSDEYEPNEISDDYDKEYLLEKFDSSLLSYFLLLFISYIKNDTLEDFSITKELILPERIEKVGDVKIIHGLKLPQEVPFSIDISKISLVKRIQTTLF